MSGFKQFSSRRVFTPEYKMQIVNDVLKGDASVSVIARQYDVNNNQVFRWVREARLGKAYWVKKAQQITGLVSPDISVSEGLLPVKVVSESVKPTVSPPPASTSMHIELHGGHRIVFHNDNTHVIAAVIKALI